MSDNYATEVAGMSTFQDINTPMLRAWNQYNVLTNIKEANLDGVGEKYISSLSKTDRMALIVIIEYVRAKGYEETKREIIANNIGLAA